MGGSVNEYSQCGAAYPQQSVMCLGCSHWGKGMCVEIKKALKNTYLKSRILKSLHFDIAYKYKNSISCFHLNLSNTMECNQC